MRLSVQNSYVSAFSSPRALGSVRAGQKGVWIEPSYLQAVLVRKGFVNNLKFELGLEDGQVLNSFLCERGLLRACVEWRPVSGRAGPMGRRTRWLRAELPEEGWVTLSLQTGARPLGAQQTPPPGAGRGQPRGTHRVLPRGCPCEPAGCLQTKSQSQQNALRPQPWGGRIWLQRVPLSQNILDSGASW